MLAGLLNISKTIVRLGGSAKASSVSTENYIFVFKATLCEDYGVFSAGRNTMAAKNLNIRRSLAVLISASH